MESEFTHDDNPAAQWTKDQVFKNSPLAMKEKFIYWAAFGLALPALTIAPRLCRAGPCVIMLAFHLSNPMCEKLHVEAAVRGSTCPIESAAVHALFASVFVGILLLPEPGVAKAKTR